MAKAIKSNVTEAARISDEKRAFLVVVNRKYIVKVEAHSNGGAEHIVLDNEYLRRVVNSALAFDPACEAVYYGWAFAECTLISFEELVQKGRNVLAAQKERLNEMLNDMSHCDGEVARLKDMLAQAEALAAEVRGETLGYAKKCGICCAWTSKEEIANLRVMEVKND